MSSPALNEKVIRKISEIADESKMTIPGTINKTGFLFLFLTAGAVFGWDSNSPGLLIFSMISAFVLSLVIIYGPHRAPYLSQVYALSEGLVLGSISSMYANVYPGIVSNALLLTFSCLIVMLGLYRTRIIRVTDKFRSILFGATIAIALTYLVSLILGLFGTSIPMIHENTPVGIGFSLVVVLVAAFNLLLDFDLIEQAHARGAPQFMEWYLGFALMLTLVWLYLEILRLLSKLNRK